MKSWRSTSIYNAAHGRRRARSCSAAHAVGSSLNSLLLFFFSSFTPRLQLERHPATFAVPDAIPRNHFTHCDGDRTKLLTITIKKSQVGQPLRPFMHKKNSKKNCATPTRLETLFHNNMVEFQT